MEGLNFIRCLAAFHCDLLNTKLHETNFAVVQEVMFSDRLSFVLLEIYIHTYLSFKLFRQFYTTFLSVFIYEVGPS